MELRKTLYVEKLYFRINFNICKVIIVVALKMMHQNQQPVHSVYSCLSWYFLLEKAQTYFGLVVILSFDLTFLMFLLVPTHPLTSSFQFEKQPLRVCNCIKNDASKSLDSMQRVLLFIIVFCEKKPRLILVLVVILTFDLYFPFLPVLYVFLDVIIPVREASIESLILFTIITLTAFLWFRLNPIKKRIEHISWRFHLYLLLTLRGRCIFTNFTLNEKFYVVLYSICELRVLNKPTLFI